MIKSSVQRFHFGWDDEHIPQRVIYRTTRGIALRAYKKGIVLWTMPFLKRLFNLYVGFSFFCGLLFFDLDLLRLYFSFWKRNLQNAIFIVSL